MQKTIFIFEMQYDLGQQVAVAKPLDRKRKRVRDESQSKSASKTSNPVPALLRNDHSHSSPAGGQAKAPKLKYLIKVGLLFLISLS